jgi:uncharacterized protein (TIGR03437 family)
VIASGLFENLILRAIVYQVAFLSAELLVFSILFAQVPPALSSQLSLPSQSATPGASIVLPAEFVSQADSVSGVQFDLEYDGSSIALVVMPGDAARKSCKNLYYADLSPNKRRFLIVGLNQNIIPDGTLIDLLVNLNPNAANDVYKLSFSNVVGTDPYGSATSVTGADGSVAVHGTSGQGVPLQSAGVLNGASLLPGPVAPGEVVTLIGLRIGTSPMAPVSAQFDGTFAPILYKSPNLINILVPQEVSGKTTVRLRVTNGGRVIASLPLSVVPTVPGIFTLDASGVGPGAILNEDSTLNSRSNPAARGSVAVLFATGVGHKTSGRDGPFGGKILHTALPVSVQTGGLNAEVLEAGPELMAGVLQVKFRIPANVLPGYSVPVVLKVGLVSSQPRVTLAIQ